MGEKGNSIGDPVTAVAAVVEPSLVERVTTTTTSTVVGVGQDFLETVKDKAVGAVADATIAVARDRVSRRDDDPAAAGTGGTAAGAAGAGAPGAGAAGAGADGAGADGAAPGAAAPGDDAPRS